MTFGTEEGFSRDSVRSACESIRCELATFGQQRDRCRRQQFNLTDDAVSSAMKTIATRLGPVAILTNT